MRGFDFEVIDSNVGAVVAIQDVLKREIPNSITSI
jgi:hypothetical protein